MVVPEPRNRDLRFEALAEFAWSSWPISPSLRVATKLACA